MQKSSAIFPKLIIDTVAIKKGAEVYKSLYHPLRLSIIEMIHRSGSLNVTIINKNCKLEQSMVSGQLKILRDKKILNAQRKGKEIYYSVNYKYVQKLNKLTRQLIPLPPYVPPSAKASKSSNVENIKFTPAEQNVIRLVCDQHSTREIAEKLGLGIRTVEGYRAAILQKIKARNIAGIVLFAIKNGLYKI